MVDTYAMLELKALIDHVCIRLDSPPSPQAAQTEAVHDGAHNVTWMDCKFNGPTPEGTESWLKWMIEGQYCGVSICRNDYMPEQHEAALRDVVRQSEDMGLYDEPKTEAQEREA